MDGAASDAPRAAAESARVQSARKAREAGLGVGEIGFHRTTASLEKASPVGEGRGRYASGFSVASTFRRERHVDRSAIARHMSDRIHSFIRRSRGLAYRRGGAGTSDRPWSSWFRFRAGRPRRGMSQSKRDPEHEGSSLSILSAWLGLVPGRPGSRNGPSGAQSCHRRVHARSGTARAPACRRRETR